MKCKSTLLVFMAAFVCAACTSPDTPDYETTDDGIVVTPTQAGAARVRLAVLAPGIVRVTAAPGDDFERAPSLMRSEFNDSPPITRTTERSRIVASRAHDARARWLKTYEP